jgi:hypothetical protein
MPERISWDDVAETQAVQEDGDKKSGSRLTAH